IEQFKLGIAAGTAAIFFDEPAGGERRLRVFVKEFLVGVGGGGVEGEIILLDVLAVVGLVGGGSGEALLEERVAAVPEGEGEEEQLVAVAKAGDGVLAPAVGLAAGVVVGQELPGAAVGAVVLADGAPGAVGNERPPAPPVGQSASVFLQALL